MKNKLSFIALLLTFLTYEGKAQLTTSKLFGDHMVLQRNKPVAVWGISKPKAKVTLSINGEVENTKADAVGNWKLLLKPMKEGGPYEMNITSGKQHIQYTDIMLGEVWICSGQSNMEFELRNTDGYKAEQNIAANQTIRQFLVPKILSLKPEKDLTGGAWVKADANTIGGFTAVGYYFAKQLAAQLHVTVGLVHSSWGGTQAECWVSKDALLKSSLFAKAAQSQPDDMELLRKKVEEQTKAYAYKNQEAKFYNIQQLMNEPVSFFNNWQTGTEGTWMWQGKWLAYRGEGFMQRTITLNSAQANEKFTLRLGQTYTDMEVYLNGKPVFRGTLQAGQPIEIPAGTGKAGENSLLIDLFSAQKNQPWTSLGLIGDAKDLYLQSTDTTINLAGFKWKLMADFSKPYHVELMPNNTVYTLYNGMISPLLNLSIAGVTWYQGESNASRAYEYRTLLPLMITNWREKWKADFPFIIMQLPMYGPSQNSNQGSTWAELREAQAMTLKVPNTALVVTTDLGDPNNLHPTNKAPFGLRMANVALNNVYHLPGYYVSPLFKAAAFQQGYALVSINTKGEGLITKDKYGYLKGFELAGTDHKFYFAKAEIVNNQVKVWCNEVPQPVAVRYAWSDSPVDADLFIKEGLPVAPFRSDTWKGLTDKSKFTD